MTTKLTPLALAFAAIFATSAQAQSATDLQQPPTGNESCGQAMKAAADAQRARNKPQALAQAQPGSEAKAKPLPATQSTGSATRRGQLVTLYGLIDVTLTRRYATPWRRAHELQPAPWFSGSRWPDRQARLGDGSRIFAWRASS